MLNCDDDLLLVLHWMSPANVPAVVTPIAQALQRHWHGEVVVAYPPQVQIWLDPEPRVLIGDRAVLPTLVHTRVASDRGSYNGVLLRCLEELGAQVLNPSKSGFTASSKFLTAVRLAAAGLPMPDQSLLASNQNRARVEGLGALGWPQVIKRDQGWGGMQVSLAADTGAVQSLLDCDYVVPDHPDPFVAQQFRGETNGRDVRVVVTGGRVSCAVERRGPAGDFRSNIQLGGTAHPTELTAEEEKIAIRAAEALDLVVAGVDLMRTDVGPMVTEVNSTPGLTGAVACYGSQVYDDIATAVIDAWSARR